jgi:hypothetical protein
MVCCTFNVQYCRYYSRDSKKLSNVHVLRNVVCLST